MSLQQILCTYLCNRWLVGYRWKVVTRRFLWAKHNFVYQRIFLETSKTEVLQMPSATDANLGYGVMSPIYRSSQKRFYILKN